MADQNSCKIRKISSSGLVSTLAGSGQSGSADGEGSLAKFFYPVSVAVDGNGNVYVADNYNNKIRKVTPSGFVSTFAGSGLQGSTDGQGTAASFYEPRGVALDANGNVYVSDSQNKKIRKISPTGLVSTLAGSGLEGSIDGNGAAASFYLPTGIAVDANGYVYVAGNELIRKISPAGFVTRLAGTNSNSGTDGQGTATSLSSPSGVAIDAAGNFYVSDYYKRKILKISSKGLGNTLAGPFIEGPGTAAGFDHPTGVTVDVNGNVYVAVEDSNIIRKISPSGLVSTVAGSGTKGSADGQGIAASFHYPTDVAVDANGNLYVADRNNNKIRKISSTGLVSTLAGSGIVGSADGQGTVASFQYPYGLAVDATGNVYVADTKNLKIRKISSTGLVTTLAGSGKVGGIDAQGTEATFGNPTSLAIDAKGNLYVTDGNNIRKISSTGLVSTIAGSGNPGSTDGQGLLASFSSPNGVAIDANGDLYVADEGNSKIRKITVGDPLAIEKQELTNEAIYLYPNPGKNTLYTHGIQNIASYQVLDAAGVQYAIATYENNTLDISNLQSGIYFLKASTETGQLVFKFIKE